MTSIEWLATYLKGITSLNCDDIIEQAKEMHKQEIIEAYDKNKMGRVNYGEQYYQETFKKD